MVSRQPTLDTLSASTGYVRCRDPPPISTRSQPPQGMSGSETASTGYVRCRDPPNLDTLSASTGYVWFRDSQHSIRSQPPQGMSGSETANTRHALSLHRVCEVPRPPQSRHALSLHRVCVVPIQPVLDTLSASTWYV